MSKKIEISLVIIVIIIVIVLDIITNFISNKSVEKMSNEIIGLIEEINVNMELKNEGVSDNKKQEKLYKNMQNFKESWLNEEAKLSIFAEHDELEKVTICVVEIEENIKNKKYEEALLNGANFLYWLNHFKNKDKLEWENFF